MPLTPAQAFAYRDAKARVARASFALTRLRDEDTQERIDAVVREAIVADNDLRTALLVAAQELGIGVVT